MEQTAKGVGELDRLRTEIDRLTEMLNALEKMLSIVLSSSTAPYDNDAQKGLAAVAPISEEINRIVNVNYRLSNMIENLVI